MDTLNDVSKNDDDDDSFLNTIEDFDVSEAIDELEIRNNNNCVVTDPFISIFNDLKEKKEDELNKQIFFVLCVESMVPTMKEMGNISGDVVWTTLSTNFWKALQNIHLDSYARSTYLSIQVKLHL